MSNKAFQQNLDDKKGPQPGGPYLIQMLFKEPVEMPDKEMCIRDRGSPCSPGGWSGPLGCGTRRRSMTLIRGPVSCSGGWPESGRR